jgi:hypothetical protein
MFTNGPEFATDRCVPPDPIFELAGSYLDPWGPGAVFAGQTVTGNVCFPDDLHETRLLVVPTDQFPPQAYVDGVPNYPPSPLPYRTIWFALR